MVHRVRQGGGPLVVEFRTVRLGPHSKGDDTRTAAELDRAQERDWYAVLSRTIPERFAAEDARQRERVEWVVDEVAARPPAAWEPA
jgi:pyruvate dehydrogenase E1 component alpha subunit